MAWVRRIRWISSKLTVFGVKFHLFIIVVPLQPNGPQPMETQRGNLLDLTRSNCWMSYKLQINLVVYFSLHHSHWKNRKEGFFYCLVWIYIMACVYNKYLYHKLDTSQSTIWLCGTLEKLTCISVELLGSFLCLPISASLCPAQITMTAYHLKVSLIWDQLWS